MYNVSVGPSKIVAKTRRGISQNLESFQNFSRKPIDLDNGEVMNGPKPVFHTSNKKFSNSKQQEIISPQHEELIRFVSESWSKIFKEYESDTLEESETFSTSNSSSTVMYYEDPEPNAFLQRALANTLVYLLLQGRLEIGNVQVKPNSQLTEITRNLLKFSMVQIFLSRLAGYMGLFCKPSRLVKMRNALWTPYLTFWPPAS